MGLHDLSASGASRIKRGRIRTFLSLGFTLRGLRRSLHGDKDWSFAVVRFCRWTAAAVKAKGGSDCVQAAHLRVRSAGSHPFSSIQRLPQQRLGFRKFALVAVQRQVIHLREQVPLLRASATRLGHAEAVLNRNKQSRLQFTQVFSRRRWRGGDAFPASAQLY